MSCGGYVPYRRLQRAEIAATFGKGGGRGTRSVASFDEDTTTMGFEAARLALRGAPPDTTPDSLWFATADPAYLDKTNATAIHAALRLDSSVPAFDAGASVRAASGLLRSALSGSGTTLIVTADRRTGLPTSAEESASGDAAAAALIGSDGDGPLLAECLGGWSATEEFLDRWRTPGDSVSRTWEERFGETRYVPLGEEAWTAALKGLDLTAADIDHVIVAGLHGRATKGLARRLGVADDAVVDDLTSAVGNAGVAQPLLVLTDLLERAAQPHQVIALVVLADGADVTVFRTTDALTHHAPARSVGAQVAAAADLPYGRFLSWTEQVTVEPPNRPPPDRPSASAAARTEDWKFGFVGSQDRQSGAVHLPPHRVSMLGGAIDEMDPIPLGDARGTIVTYTVDRLVYSPSPPVVFAVIDFDGGGRTACELTDVDPAEVEIGGRVEMTFRRLFTSPDGIHNYFWKARPVRDTADRAEPADEEDR